MSSSMTPLADRLLTARNAAEPPQDRAALERFLRDAIAGARAAWPSLPLAAEDFVDALAPLAGESGAPEPALAALRIDDLYLAVACGLGMPEAAVAFEARYGGELVAAVERARLPGVAADDVAQAVRAAILVGDGERPPRIRQYEGRGELGGWLRVAAVRTALMVLRERRREVPIHDGHLAALVQDDRDPELAYLKGLYAGEFRAAFAESLAALESRDRNLLRYHYLERVSLDRLAAMYQVHRVSVSRWLAEARAQIVDRTVSALRRRMKVSDSEFQSLVQLLRSRVDVSVRALLRDATDPPP